MPKVVVTPNRVRVHVDHYWKLYDKHPEWFKEFRRHDVGRDGYTYRVSALYRGRWITYAWEFDRNRQVEFKPKTKTFFVFDRKAYMILKNLKERGELKGYRVFRRYRVD